MQSLNKQNIIDPRLKAKLGIDENSPRFQATLDLSHVNSSLGQATRHSSNIITNELLQLESSRFNPLEAISTVLGNKQQSRRVNGAVTRKVSYWLK